MILIHFWVLHGYHLLDGMKYLELIPLDVRYTWATDKKFSLMTQRERAITAVTCIFDDMGGDRDYCECQELIQPKWKN